MAEAVDAACCAAGQLFEDPHFPQCQQSIEPDGEGGSLRVVAGKWARVTAAGTPWVGPSSDAAHVLQGAISDCWLVSILGSLHLRAPDRVQRLFATPWATRSGACAVRLFIPPIDAWHAIVLDDAIPVDAAGTPRFARCAAALPPWPALVEKAFAKLLGGYARLAAASGWAPTVERAMSMLTAGPARTLRLHRAGRNAVATELRALSRTAAPPWVAAAVWQCSGPDTRGAASHNHHAVAIEGFAVSEPARIGGGAINSAAGHSREDGEAQLIVRNDVTEADAATAQRRFPAFPAAGRSRYRLAAAMDHVGAIAVCAICDSALPMHSVLIRGEWAPPVAGGYGSSANPQFLLQLDSSSSSGIDDDIVPAGASSGRSPQPALRVELHPAEDALRETEHAAFLRVAPAGPAPVVPLRTLRGLKCTAVSAYRRGAPAVVEVPRLPTAASLPEESVTSFRIAATWGKTGAGAAAPFALIVRASRPVVVLHRLQ